MTKIPEILPRRGLDGCYPQKSILAMASVVPTSGKIKTFRTEAAFESWMRKNHLRESEVWLRIYKTASAVPSITIAEALDVVLCWGWIDGIRKAFDERSYLQRYTPRRAKSIWSQINRNHVVRLTKAGRMTPHGQRQVDAAKADGRWNAAYAPMRGALGENFPSDLRKAIEASPGARRTFQSLGRQNLYALAFRTGNMKTAAGRARKIAALVDMLERGETPYPERR
jgi:uncharacterized protein YdeI (YjbR/CyaY-like superfamily)